MQIPALSPGACAKLGFTRTPLQQRQKAARQQCQDRDTWVTGSGAAPQPQILVNWLLISADISFKYSLKEKIKVVSIRIT